MEMNQEKLLRAIEKATKAGDTDSVDAMKAMYDNKFGSARNEPRNLSDEELEYRRQKVIDAREGTQAKIDDHAFKEGVETHQREVMTGNAEAIAKGALQGATGLVDEAQAAFTAAGETIEEISKGIELQGMSGFDNIFSTYGESFHRNRRMYKEELEQLEKDHPDAYGAAEVAGSIGGSIAIGTLFPAGIVGSLASMGTYGLVHGAAGSEAETLGGRVAGAVEGGTQELLVGAAFGAAGKVGRAVGGKTINKLSEASFIQFLGNKINKTIGTGGAKVGEFANRMVNYKNRSKKSVLTWGANVEQTLLSVDDGLKETSEEIASLWGHMDNHVPFTPADASRAVSTLRENVLTKIQPIKGSVVKSSDNVKMQQKMAAKLEADFFTSHPTTKIKSVDGAINPVKVPLEMTPSGLNALKSTYYKFASSHGGHDGIDAKHWKNAADTLHGFLDDHVATNAHKVSKAGTTKTFLNDMGFSEGYNFIEDVVEDVTEDALFKTSSKQIPDSAFYSLYKATNTKYKDLLHSKTMLKDKLQKPQDTSVFNSIFRGGFNSLSLAGTAAASVAGYQGLAVASAVTAGVLALSRNPRVNSAATLSLNKMANAFKANPDRYSKLAMKIAVASDVSSDAFKERIMEAGAEVDLTEVPLQRNFDDVLSRRDSLLSMARVYHEDLYDPLKEAIDTGNSQAVGALLTSSQEMSKFVSPGMGWEGKALSKQDRQSVATYIKGLSPRDRRQASMDFQKSNQIPTKMLTGEDPRNKQIQVLYNMAKEKINKPEY